MRIRHSLLGFAAVAVVTAVALTGCDRGPSSPGADPTVRPPAGTPTATPTPSEDPLAPAFIGITSQGVDVGANNESQLIAIPFSTDIATAAAQLSSVIGVEPTVTPIAETSCAPATATYDWGGLELFTTVPFNEPGGGVFVARATAAETHGGLALVGPYNQSVGTPLADVLANVPGSVSGDRGEGHIEAVLDPHDEGGTTWGVILDTQDGLVSDFYAPGLFLIGHGSCG
jgi:hypothetical protein